MLNVLCRKSQTALEYLHEIRRTSPSVSVFWVQASNQTVFERSLLEIGQYYRSFIEEDGDTDLAGTIEDVKTILQADDSSQWLLVIDDIDLSTFDDIQALYSSIPDSKNGSIIYTTRNKQTAYDLVEPSHVIIMEPLSVAHAHQLLNFQLGRQIPLDADLLKLFAILDYLPLAIVQAAGYMCVNSISICACLAHIQRSEECKANLLRYARPSTMDAKPPYAPILLSIVSIDAIYDQNEAAAELLFTMACMESRHVPTCLFTTGENTTIEMDAFSILKAYSLITMNDADTVLDVQSLVHLAVRLHLKSINRFEVYLQRCFTLLASRFPPEGEQFLKLDQCALYLPHALEVWNTYVGVPEVESTSSVDCNMAERLASRISRYLRIIGQYAEAKVFAQSALEWSIKASGEGSTRSLACKRNVAAIDLYLGNHKSSDQAINDILDAQIDLLEKNDPAVISTLNEKGLALQVQGRHAEAEDYHQHAVFITESLYGADDNRTLDQQQNLALSLMGQGKHVNALNILQVVLDSLEESLGSTNTKTLSTLVNISCVLQHLARWEEAGKYLEQALLGRQKLLGAEHPHTLQCKANLAQIYRQQGDLSKAEGVTREVLQSHQSQLGSQHPTTLHINRNLALLLQCRKRYDEAEKEFQRVRRGREKRLGCEHPDTLISMYDLSVVYHYQGRLDEALELGRSVFDVRTRTLEDGHADRRASERHIQQLEIDYDEWLTSTTLAESGEET
jgi:tetratricopeptide (TPR) repeat protein